VRTRRPAHQPVPAGEHAGRALHGEQRDQQQERDRPPAGDVAQRTHRERTRGREDVAHALRHAGQMGCVRGVRRPHRDEGEREAQRGALRGTQQDQGHRLHADRCEHAEQPDRGDGRDADGEPALASPAGGEHRGDRGARDPGHGGEREQPAGHHRVVAPLDEQGRQPGRHREVAQGLQAHVDGDLPRHRVAPEPARPFRSHPGGTPGPAHVR
jgi:hypothetical protein